MTEYWLGPESGCLCATPLFKTDLSFFTIMTIDEFTKQKKNLPITRRFFIIWVLSATVRQNCLKIVFWVPSGFRKRMNRKKHSFHLDSI